MSKRSSRTTTNERQSATSNPIVPGYVQQPIQGYFAQVGQLGTTGRPQVYGATGNQQAAFQGAGGLDAGLGNVRSLLNYTPGTLAGADLSAYTNPWQRSVTDTTIADWQHGNELGINALKAATPTGAFGGSRQGVAMGQLLGDNSRTLASVLANLNQAGFQNAQQAAQFDIGTGLEGARYRLGAANDYLTNNRANLDQQYRLGEAERTLNVQNDPFNQEATRLALLQQLLGVNPSDLFGQQMNSTGSRTSKTKESGFGLSWSPKNGLSIGGGG